MIIVFFVLTAFFSSLYPASIGLSVIPIALGQARWPYRLVGLYVSAIVLGILPTLMSVGFQYGLTLIVGILSLVAATARTFRFLEIGNAWCQFDLHVADDPRRHDNLDRTVSRLHVDASTRIPFDPDRISSDPASYDSATSAPFHSVERLAAE